MVSSGRFRLVPDGMLVPLFLITLIDPLSGRGPDGGRRVRAVFGVL